MAEPNWLHKKEPTRKKSGKQEKFLAKMFDGKLTCNSGAKYSENDVRTKEYEIEAKTTEGKGYRLTVEELLSIRKKTRLGKVPLQIIEFSTYGESFVVLSLNDFEELKNKK